LEIVPGQVSHRTELRATPTAEPYCTHMVCLRRTMVFRMLAVVAALGCLGTLSSVGSPGAVDHYQKISDLNGGFAVPLDDEDAFGVAVASLGDLNRDGVVDLAVGATGDDDGGQDRGAVYILFLSEDGTVDDHTKISSTQGGFTGTLSNADNFGTSLATIGDLDDDGVQDIAVGAVFDDDGGTDRGAIWILFLNADGTVKNQSKISDTTGGFDGELGDRDYFGFSLAAIGDLDGDGIEDLATGVSHDDDGGADRGAVYVLFLSKDGTVRENQKISSASGGFTGTLDDGDDFGRSVAFLGAQPGLGASALAVGADTDDDGGVNRGAVYILSLAANGMVNSHSKISDTEGGLSASLANSDLFGRAVSGVADANGDTIPDIVVNGGRDDDGATDSGALYVLFMNLSGYVSSWSKISNTAGNLGAILDHTDLFGQALCRIGDLDGNGAEDVVASSKEDDDGGINRGALYVLFMEATFPGTGDVNLDGQIDLLDVRLCLQIANGILVPTPPQWTQADVDGSGVVDMQDVQALGEYVIGIRTHLPYEDTGE